MQEEQDAWQEDAPVELSKETAAQGTASDAEAALHVAAAVVAGQQVHTDEGKYHPIDDNQLKYELQKLPADTYNGRQRQKLEIFNVADVWSHDGHQKGMKSPCDV